MLKRGTFIFGTESRASHQEGRRHVFKNIHTVNTSYLGLLLIKISMEIRTTMLNQFNKSNVLIEEPMYSILGCSDFSPRICIKEGSDCLFLAIFHKDSFSRRLVINIFIKKSSIRIMHVYSKVSNSR